MRQFGNRILLDNSMKIDKILKIWIGEKGIEGFGDRSNGIYR
jgi:hypothetical protein